MAQKSGVKSHEFHVMLNIAAVKEELDDLAGAISNLEQALEIDPDNQRITDKIAQL